MEQPKPATLKEQKFNRQWVDSLFQEAQNRKWFGNITVEIKKGMIKLVRSEETLKPPNIE